MNLHEFMKGHYLGPMLDFGEKGQNLTPSVTHGLLRAGARWNGVTHPDALP